MFIFQYSLFILKRVEWDCEGTGIVDPASSIHSYPILDPLREAMDYPSCHSILSHVISMVFPPWILACSVRIFP